jgi:hypothetical protein
MARMNWNRPNGGYEREPWDKDKQYSGKAKSEKPFFYSYATWKKIEPVMTDEQRKKIQALRKK